MADDSVVVMKSQPVKAGNSLEDKTEMILDLIQEAVIAQKAVNRCEGMK